MNKLLIYLFIFIIFSGCKNSTEQSTNQSVELFDLKPIVEKDIDYNNTHHVRQKKVINIDNQQDIIQVEEVDWTKELQVVFNADINKKDWQDKFTVQKTDNLDSTETIRYVAINNKVPIKQFSVIRHKNNQLIKEIYIEKIIQSGLFSNSQIITYKPTEYLKVKSIQKAFFMNDFVSEIEIYFIH